MFFSFNDTILSRNIHFFTVEQVKKNEYKYQLSSKIVCVGTIPESTLELNNPELQKSTHQHQYFDLGSLMPDDRYHQRQRWALNQILNIHCKGESTVQLADLRERRQDYRVIIVVGYIPQPTEEQRFHHTIPTPNQH